jgi:hypothetical protein
MSRAEALIISSAINDYLQDNNMTVQHLDATNGWYTKEWKANNNKNNEEI